jgi:glutamine amidotransferase-like uncharacterized protein
MCRLFSTRAILSYRVCLLGTVFILLYHMPAKEGADSCFSLEAFAAQSSQGSKSDSSPVRIAVYSGEGAFSRSIIAATKMFEWMGAETYQIAPEDIIAGKLENFDILYMTGGWAVPYIRDLRGSGVAKIRTFIQAGGGYIGVCAGAFFAADYIFWEGKRYEYPLDLFSGYARGPIEEIAPWPRYTLCRIRLSRIPHPITEGEPEVLTSLYYGGPWFELAAGFNADVLAVYEINRLPAMLSYEYGRGRVFLTGVHTEFEEDDERDNVLWDNDMHDPESEWPLMQKAVRWLIHHKTLP